MNAVVNRIRMLLARAVIAAVDDARSLQALQVDVLADETHDGVERFGNYGLTSAPHPGAEAVVAFVGGLRSHGLAIAVEDRRYRLRGLRTGEVALYDDLGQAVVLSRDGVRIVSTKPVSIETPHASISADRVDLGGAGGAKVARVGDDVVAGKIVSGSGKVFAA